MCGIAGYVGPTPPDEGRVRRCLELMRHRGPDGQGVYRHAFSQAHQVCLLHTRLAIIDLDPRSAQPMSRGGHVLTLNGELYNYQELRTALTGAGQNFQTQGDAEVLLGQLRVHGEAGLDACEGMWAFAWYDEATGRLVLSRDRFGEKPLYLCRRDGGLYWGSEVKFIAALSGRSLQANRNHVLRYLVNGYKCIHKSRETFFEEIESLDSARVLTRMADGRTQVSAYWRSDFEIREAMTLEEAVEGLRERLVESVRLRLQADVPLAFCMSGGVDSNALIAVARTLLNREVHGFTVASSDARYDERERATAAARDLGVRHTVVPVTTREFLDNLARMVRQHDAPVYTISYYIHWLLMAAISREGHRVAISGTAADELLTGYYDHHNLWLHEMRTAPAYANALAAWREHIAPLVRNPALKNPELYFDDPDTRDHVTLGSDLARSALRTDWREAFTERNFTGGLLRNRMLNELFEETVPVLLHEDDLNAMHHSIENRSPFLDRKLAEWCFRIPTRHLMHAAWTKYPLRKAMDGLAPANVLWSRHKIGFNASVLELLDTRSAAVRACVLDDGPIFELVRRESIEQLMNCPTLTNSESKFLFSFVSARLFLDAFAAA